MSTELTLSTYQLASGFLGAWIVQFAPPTSGLKCVELCLHAPYSHRAWSIDRPGARDRDQDYRTRPDDCTSLDFRHLHGQVTSLHDSEDENQHRRPDNLKSFFLKSQTSFSLVFVTTNDLLEIYLSYPVGVSTKPVKPAPEK